MKNVILLRNLWIYLLNRNLGVGPKESSFKQILQEIFTHLRIDSLYSRGSLVPDTTVSVKVN